ncbi:MAG: hypothetical protein JWO38_2351 [Gemmataceae bacterium]|nr:hypothetical protein [Gemmataceae bacterium]
MVYGSVAFNIGSVVWNGTNADGNTAPLGKVFVPFDVVPSEQMIVFDEPVYAWAGTGGVQGQLDIPNLVLETGCLIENPETNQLVRWLNSIALGGTAPAEWMVRDDVGVGVVGQYNAGSALVGFKLQDEADAQSRAQYYINGMLQKYQLPGSLTRQYAGIMPIDPDGLIQQVTWSVGPGGPTTMASANAEHAAAIPDYPARRRAENLPPNKAAELANLTDRLAGGPGASSQAKLYYASLPNYRAPR